jgi:N-methylhydantoinase B
MTKVDPVTLQVIGGALHTIAKEMAYVLYRMSFSSIIRESEDLGAGLFDCNFATLCESDNTPLHIGSIPGYLRGIAETMATPWREGDIVIHNHPYFGASHSPDIAVVAPVFYKGRHIGFAANTAHHVDIGSATPGLIVDIQDIFGEGMLFKAAKLFDAGVRNEELWRYLRNNSRVGKQLQDDLGAQIASAQLGGRRFQELYATYGAETVEQASRDLMDYTEQMLRRRIAEIPDGDYCAESWLDDDGRNRGVRLPIKVCVRIRGDSAEVDLTGSSPQVPTAFNVPFEGSTKVACYVAFRSLLLDTYASPVSVPANEGSFRPIKVTAPRGTIFNPIFPTAASARFSQCNRMIDCIIRALSPVLPEAAIAGSSASLSFVAYSGLRPSGDYWVFIEVNEGAYGGRATSDGPDSIDNLMANTRNNPIEDLGMHLPMICDRYELRDDVACGAGKHRGGIGVVKHQRMLEGGWLTHEAERHTDVPWGLFGGSPGAVGRVDIFNHAAPHEAVAQYAKISGVVMKPGDTMAFYSPCGGGYGDPYERPAEKVLDDVLDGFCTPAYAASAYGVVVDGKRIDAKATAALRARPSHPSGSREP